MSVPFSQQEKLFHEALKFTDTLQRRLFLDETCAGNSELRAVIDNLLAAEGIGRRFFDQRESALSWFEKDVQFTVSNPSLLQTNLPGEEQPGTCLGYYKLIQKIGEGGCGVVYMAEQTEPVRRQVALKVIKLGMDTKRVIARFATERQALASMEHPNIAHVFDAGATAAGRPYFVMELVRGAKITEFCDQNHLDTSQRLDLFLQICQAIQHAHQKGIIHRDIKPSNILVALHDGVPVPKVIDFGIAKVTENQLADRTQSTAVNQLLGTPAYMSPEQADMSGTDVDTRSDIYSLGVLLYELLTGRTPFDGKKLFAGGFDEMRRTLREVEPQPPSTMIGTLQGAELQKTAELRQAEAPRLVSILKGDLDWIVLKALEKDRSQRYETVNGLAMDLKRFLNDEPVTARPQSQMYRFKKLVKRNKLIFAAGTTVAVALIIGLGTATWMFFKEKEARGEAVAAEQEQTVLRQEADLARRRAEIREDVTKTAFAISRDYFEDADKNVPEISDAPPSLESAAVFRSLGEWHALNGQYKIASDRFAILSQDNQYDSWNVVTADLLAQAAVLAEQGNSAKYERFRDSAIKRFGATFIPEVAERIIKATLLLPAKNPSYSTLGSLVKVTLPKLPQTILVPPPSNMSWRDSHDNSDTISDGTSESSGLIPDEKVSPAVVGVGSLDGRSIEVDFNLPVNPTVATNRLNYVVPGTVTNVTMGIDGNSVLLWPASELNGQFSVSASNLQTTASNPVTFGGAATNTVQNLKLLAMGDAADTVYSASYRGGVSTVIAGGSDTWKTGDNVIFQYLTVTNDFDYRLRIASLSGGGDPFTRCCLMVRDSLTDTYGHMVFICRNSGPNAGNTNSDSVQVNMRTTVGRRVESQPANPLPAFYGSNSWVRLQRSQNIFTSFYSSNGLDWVQLYQFDGASSGDYTFTNCALCLGIATCAHSFTQTVTAVTANFGITPHAPVKIIRQPPTSVTWHQGAPASLGIVLAGDAISYQWQANGLEIPGATNATLSVPAVRLSDAAAYSVLAYNDINSITSRRINVTVLKDTSPPILNNIVSYDGLSIGLTYNKLVDPASATNRENYSVNGIAVTEARLLPDDQSVALRLDNPVAGKFVVTVNNVQDLSRNSIAGGSKITGYVLALKLVKLGDAALQLCPVSYIGNISTTSAGGSDIGGNKDHLVFQYLLVTNDFDYRLRVHSVTGGGGKFARTGLMARDSITNNSSHQLMVAVNADGTFQVLVRTVAGANMTQSQPPNPLPLAFGSNSWVRLQRIGTIFYTYISSDGDNWEQLYQFDSTGDADGPFANPIYLGVASSAGSNKKSATTVVSDLGINRTVPISTMISLALLEYRQDNYTRAAEWCRLCLSSDYQAAHIATAHIILAMCYLQLHHLAEARFELATGRDTINVKFSTGLDHGNSAQGFWFDWLSAHVLMREAEALIQ